MSYLKKVDQLRKIVQSITTQEMQQLHELVTSQKGYVHPLKNGRASKINAAGTSNETIVAAIKQLRNVFDATNPAAKSISENELVKLFLFEQPYILRYRYRHNSYKLHEKTLQSLLKQNRIEQVHKDGKHVTYKYIGKVPAKG